jgi:hypothetical protein
VRDEFRDAATRGKIPDEFAGLGRFALPFQVLIVYPDLGAQGAQLVVAEIIGEIPAE